MDSFTHSIAHHPVIICLSDANCPSGYTCDDNMKQCSNVVKGAVTPPAQNDPYAYSPPSAAAHDSVASAGRAPVDQGAAITSIENGASAVTISLAALLPLTAFLL